MICATREIDRVEPTVSHRFIKGNLTGGVVLDALRTFLTVSFPISTLSPGEIRVAVVVAVGTQ